MVKVKQKMQIPYLQIPIAKYSVKFGIRDPEEFQKIHLLVLELIHHNPNLDSFLEKPVIEEHLFQEVLTDLIYKNLAFLDLREGKIQLAESVKELIETGKLDEISKMKPHVVEEVLLIRDLTTGTVLNHRSIENYTHFPKNPSLINVPKLQEEILIPIEELSVGTLGKASLDILSKKTKAEEFDENNIARIEEITLLTVNEMMYIPIKEVECEDSSILKIPQARVPSSLLTKWKEIINDHKTLYMYDDSAKEGDPCMITPQEYVEPVLSLVKELHNNMGKKGRSKYARNLFNEFSDVERVFLDKFQKILLSMKDWSVIAGRGEAFKDLLEDVGARSKGFILICSAFLSKDAISSIAPYIREANEKGIQVILVWGMLGDYDNTDELRRIFEIKRDFILIERYLFDELELDKHLCRFYKTKKPSHVKYIYYDSIGLAIGSFNYLSTSLDSTQYNTMGHVFDGYMPIDFTNYVIDNVALEEDMRNLLSEFSRKQNEDLQTRMKKKFERFTKVKEKIESLKDIIDSYLLLEEKMSYDDMNKKMIELTNYLKMLGRSNSASIIMDGDHRQALISSFHIAKKSIRISSDKISTHAVGPVFTNSLEKALRNDVNVKIIWGKENPNSKPTKEVIKSKKIAEVLSQKSGKKFSINENPIENHSKVLLIDSQRLITSSFNFLSLGTMTFEHYLPPQELGLIITNPHVDEAIERELPWIDFKK